MVVYFSEEDEVEEVDAGLDSDFDLDDSDLLSLLLSDPLSDFPFDPLVDGDLPLRA